MTDKKGKAVILTAKPAVLTVGGYNAAEDSKKDSKDPKELQGRDEDALRVRPGAKKQGSGK